MNAMTSMLAATGSEGGLPLGEEAFWWTGGIVLAVLAAAFLFSHFLRSSKRIGASFHRELVLRIRTWAIIVPAVLIPVGLGPLGVRLATVGLGLLCFREFSNASGLARDRLLSRVAMLAVAIFAGIGLDGNLSRALIPTTFVALTVAGLISCQAEMFLSRVSLAVVAVAWFGLCLGTLGDLASEADHLLTVLWLILCVEFNDVAAFVGGKLLKGPKLCPHLSPGKTVSGALVALAATTLLAGFTGSWFREGDPVWLFAVLGSFISLAGQMGDLAMSAVKRSLGIKDLGHLLRGHGGVLDRFDSLLMAGPVALVLCSVSPAFGG
jgi:phosphatidate cytidylyltransferase